MLKSHSRSYYVSEFCFDVRDTLEICCTFYLSMYLLVTLLYTICYKHWHASPHTYICIYLYLQVCMRASMGMYKNGCVTWICIYAHTHAQLFKMLNTYTDDLALYLYLFASTFMGYFQSNVWRTISPIFNDIYMYWYVASCMSKCVCFLVHKYMHGQLSVYTM